MIRKLHVKNFKSIADLTLEPGAVNVLIGENGCGKSNFLEALAFASAAEAEKLDNEFLASRGIRVTEPAFMRSAFAEKPDSEIFFEVDRKDDWVATLRLLSEQADNYPRWRLVKNLDDTANAAAEFVASKMADDPKAGALFRNKQAFTALLSSLPDHVDASTGADAAVNAETARLAGYFLGRVSELVRRVPARLGISSFLIYAPENTALRTFAQEGQIVPLGIKGEGLFKLLRFLSQDAARWAELKENLTLLDWFGDLKIAPEQAPFEQSLLVRDRFLAKDFAYFDQRSANEGFLFLLFYFALVISPDTPAVFAIDNIDVSLNPKTATALMTRLAKLAKKYNKQVFLTTHSPAILDGLDLTDDDQRLFVFHRNRKGETRSRRVLVPQPVASETPIKLSDAFLRGLLGGLPQNF